MVTKSEQKYILETVGNKEIADEIVEYLKRNNKNVGYEVFKNEQGELDKRIFRFLFDENWTKERFLKYLPFFYYSEKDEEKDMEDPDYSDFWSTERSFEGVLECVSKKWEMDYLGDDSEPDYDILDKRLHETSSKLFYLYDCLHLKEGISCKKIIDYLFDNCMFDSLTFDFEDWIHYLKLCEACGNNNWFPTDLDYSLRINQETVGEKVRLIIPYNGFSREGKDLIFRFDHVPVESDGNPVLRWLGIKVDGNEIITLERIEDNYPFEEGCELLRVKTLPDTKVWRYDRKNDKWTVIYNGPRNIDVNFSLIKERRRILKLSQPDVSKAIDVSTRTYQKWESGEVKGISGFFLLRLMRYLDITLDQITLD